MAPVQAGPESGSGGDATLGVSVLVIVLVVVSVALRFYTRIFTRQGLRTDDWLILVAVITTLATAVLLLWGNAVAPDGPRASENTDPSFVYTAQDVFYLKLVFCSPVLYFTIAGATKLGILCMYYRIFHLSSAFRYQLFLSAGLVVGWWVGCTVATLTSCIPMEWSWSNSFADPRYCFNYNIFWMASGVCEIFLDVLILTLPISVVVTLQFSWKQKLTVSGIFLLGGLVVITGLVKVILGYPPGSRVPSYSNIEVWTTLHIGIAIVCSNLPILNPLLDRLLKSSFIGKISTFFSGHRGRSRSYSVVDPTGKHSELPHALHFTLHLELIQLTIRFIFQQAVDDLVKAAQDETRTSQPSDGEASTFILTGVTDFFYEETLRSLVKDESISKIYALTIPKAN
ncbi:hypothetical protein HD806DRAFT_542042 [Xylariaceae sp. AK1471]|nr:hypothetical protein HD806DRAFT_542042 [Xylariaceae sp. AK1471]